MKKFNLLLITVLFAAFNTVFAQQKVDVSGVVKDDKGSVLPGANIILKGTNLGTMSKDDGSFVIKNVAVGKYKMRVSFVGYQDKFIKLDVKNGMSSINVTLDGKSQEISETVIMSNRLHPTEESLKILAPIEDIPVTTSTVGSDLIKQRQISSINEAMRYSTGIAPSINYGGFQTFKLRGFGGPVIMVDGARDERMNFSNSAPVTSLAAVERIEYLKGPAAVLYGHSAVGGILNIVRKKPNREFSADFTANYGSWNTEEITAGAGGPLNDKLSYRFDIGMSKTDGWRDNAGKTLNGYFRTDYKISDNDKLIFTFGGNNDFYGTESGIPTVKYDIYDANSNSLIYKKGEHPKGYDREQRYNHPDDFLNHENYNLGAKYEHKFSETSRLQFQASFAHDIIDYFSTEELSYLTSKNPVYNKYFMKNDAKVYICTDSLQRTFPFKFSHHTNTYQHYVDYNFQLETGDITHKLLTGYYMSYIDRTTFKGYDFKNKDVQGAGLFAKVAFIDPILNQGDLQTKFSRASIYNEMINSLYLQDLVDISPKLKALLGLRADLYNMDYTTALVRNGTETYNEGETLKQNRFALTYRAGLVFQPTKSLSFYGSYANYFKPNRRSYSVNNIYYDKDGKEFAPSKEKPFLDPEKGYQVEGGFKYAYNSKVEISSSVFYISKENIVQYLGMLDKKSIYGQVGVVSSKGFDLEAIISPVNGLKITAGVEKTIAKYEEFSNNDYSKSAHKGNYLRGVPNGRMFAWAYYKVGSGFAKNLNLGLGFEYVGEKYMNPQNTYKLPSYSLLDANIGYSFDKVFLKFAVNNIADTDYFSGAIYGNQFIPGYGRNYKLTIGVNL